MKLRHPELTLIRFHYNDVKINSCIKLNNLPVIQHESIQFNPVLYVPLCAIWLGCLRQKVYSSSNHMCRYNIPDSKAEMELMIVAPTIEVLYWRLASHLNSHHASIVRHQPCCTHQIQGKKSCNSYFSILDNEKALQMCRYVSHSQQIVKFQTHPRLGKHCIIFWWLKLDLLYIPSATKQMNCPLIALKRCHQHC